MFNPPSMPPTVDCICESTLRAASLTAARTRSCSISTSPDFTASGSMRRLSNCFRPSIFAVTVPPPDEASTIVSCIFLCSASYCAFAFDIRSCRLNPPISPSEASFNVAKFQGFQRCTRKPELKTLELSFLSFLSVIDHGSNLGPELFLHATHHGVLFRTAASARTRRKPRLVVLFLRCHIRSRDYLQFHRLA